MNLPVKFTKSQSFLLVAVAIFVIGFNWVSPEAKSNDMKSFAVVELFTSEGCSSCPPADKALSELIDEARKKGLNIYGLSFHVDYWNYIGWKDPYSDAKYSDRQRRYGQAFQNNRIYTPQMIVNGQKEFVGSNQSKAEQSVNEALANTSSIKISMTPKLTGNQLMVDYSIAALPENAVINIALVESDLAQNVKRGENKGRLLKHDNVVREFQTLKTKNGETGFSLDGIKIQNAAIIAYVQEEKTMKILGAERVYLNDMSN